MNKLDIAKMVTSFVVGAGTSKIVTGIIQNNTSPEKLTDQVAIVAGGVVLGSMVADLSKKYTNDKIDEIALWYAENIKPKFAK